MRAWRHFSLSLHHTWLTSLNKMTFALQNSSSICIRLRSKELIYVRNVPNEKASAQCFLTSFINLSLNVSLHNFLSGVDNFQLISMCFYPYYTARKSIFAQLFQQSAGYVSRLFCLAVAAIFTKSDVYVYKCSKSICHNRKSLL